ncbi:PdxA family dehydrogenase [Polycyclovorans algicola]|jgi:4-phospho-D-threonate 3-dehydrogenase / 4-phospho-D-erythronate 3-dehydrogenase|uniref:PdxA family dehydrogenase n=1 Tax=Polycyclovorans algicola TaxID=616992 RepID=UPI0004A72C26|nr:4-hydroxythreonine-4-phosphate dehydrogenase PdxA [Polycyclovorans algicola]
MSASTHRPLVGTVIGDPCGIGPEVVAKAWCSGHVHEYSRPVLIGSRIAMEQAVRIAGLSAEVRVIGSVAELSDSANVIDILDSGALDANDITAGRDNPSCGRASGVWLDEADRLAREGVLAATVMGPISTVAMKMAGVLDRVVKVTPGESYLFLVSGPLRVSHVTDHMSLRQVCELLSEKLVAQSLVTLDERLRAWGIKAPRIGVAGLNPHAMGEEEERAIAPGVRRALDLGVNAEGPVSPDAIFRQCIDGRYDAILAMYHDQGHIAIKTWGFSGNSAVIIGPPYVHLSVAHGTAYDIVGKGIADHRMMLSAMRTAGSLAAGTGFPKEL